MNTVICIKANSWVAAQTVSKLLAFILGDLYKTKEVLSLAQHLFSLKTSKSKNYCCSDRAMPEND